MSKSIKQIYVSLELCENDLKLLVSEYYNTRFNILRVERSATKAIRDFKIVDKQLLISDIKTLVNNCSKRIGAKIEQAILIIPAYNFKCVSLRSEIVPEDGIIRKKDIAKCISDSLKYKVDSNLMVINSVVSKYYVNDIPTMKMPDRESCKSVTLDIDLLCADKSIVYDYVSIVEESGIQVLDITLNCYCICKEASLIAESLKQNIILMDINRIYSYLTLLEKGKITSSEIFYDGLNTIINSVRRKYDIPENDLIKLIKYDIDYYDNNIDDIVYAYNQSSGTRTITTSDLNNEALDAINSLVNKLLSVCKQIIDHGAVIFITGEAQQMKALVDKFKELSNCEVKSYYPDTIGVRDPSLTALYGSLIAYKEKAELYNLNVTCIDLLEYDSHVEQKDINTEGETITTKIKNLFRQYVERED